MKISKSWFKTEIEITVDELKDIDLNLSTTLADKIIKCIINSLN